MYTVTVCGLTFELPEQHHFGRDRRKQRQWYFRAVGDGGELAERFTRIDRASVDGASVRVLVTPEEERCIMIAELLRRRDATNREIKAANWMLSGIERRLKELGYATG